MRKGFIRKEFLTSLMVLSFFFLLTIFPNINICFPPLIFGNAEINFTKINVDGREESLRIMNVTHSPLYPQPNERVRIISKIEGEESKIKRVLLRYRERINFHWYGIHRYWGIYEWSWEPLTWNVYTNWMEKEMKLIENGTYEAELLELPYYSTVWYQICVIDFANNIIVSDVREYNVVRGDKTIIYDIVGDLITWLLYVSVALLLVRGLSKEESSKSSNSSLKGVKNV
ncbi:MAG: hypothetical protein QXJ19_04230 [Candidatus Bathyarchaeia archaeon]